MVKKSQTTGFPKPKKAEEPKLDAKGRVPREYRSRAEREAELQRRILIGTAIAVGLIVLVLQSA
jgi:hypothetical protein